MFAGSTGTYLWQRGYDGQHTMTLDGSGNLTIAGAAWAAGGFPSDIRIKQDIEPFERGLAALMQLSPSSFEYNGLGGVNSDGHRHASIHAQDLIAVIPEAVLEMPVWDSPDPSGHDPNRLEHQLAVDPAALIATCINAIKEMATRIAALEARPGRN
jgi:hypothetical protein